MTVAVEELAAIVIVLVAGVDEMPLKSVPSVAVPPTV